jgi:hypothetical protein
VAGVLAGTTPQLLFTLRTTYVKSEVQGLLLGVRQPVGSGSANARALNFVNNNVLQAANGYRGGLATVIVLSDGSGDTLSAVQSARTRLAVRGASLVAVSVGSVTAEGAAELAAIAGSSDREYVLSEVYNVTSTAFAEGLLRPVFCEQTTTTTVSTSTTTTTTSSPLSSGVVPITSAVSRSASASVPQPSPSVITTVSTTTTTTTTAAPFCETGDVDVVFVLDGSSTILDVEFNAAVETLAHTVSILPSSVR